MFGLQRGRALRRWPRSRAGQPGESECKGLTISIQILLWKVGNDEEHGAGCAWSCFHAVGCGAAARADGVHGFAGEPDGGAGAGRRRGSAVLGSAGADAGAARTAGEPGRRVIQPGGTKADIKHGRALIAATWEQSVHSDSGLVGAFRGAIEIALVDEAQAGEGEQLVDLADVF